MVKSVKEVVFTSSVSTTNLISDVVGELRMSMYELEEKSMRFCKNLLDMTNTTPNMAISMTTIQSLLQHTVEEYALHEVYHGKIRELQVQLRNKDMVLEELKTLVTKSDVNRFVPDIAIKVASLFYNPSDDCSILASILKNLVENREKNVKRWNDETKSLFATILDYGGPALAKIVTEKLSGPSLQTMYRSARSSYAIPMTLQERTLERAAHFYRTIGYHGVFALAVAKQANAFMLTLLQEHIPAFVLAVSPVYKGQDHALVRHWINHIILWGGRNDIMVIGLGADGDSKVRKYYVETFKKGHGERNDVIIIDNESFQFNSVMEDLREMDVAKPIPTLMFPDWRHLIKKWRNQILNVRRVLVLGKGVIQIEHLMKT